MQSFLLGRRGKEKKEMFVDISSDHKNSHDFDSRHVYQEAMKNNTLEHVEQIEIKGPLSTLNGPASLGRNDGVEMK